MCSQIKGTVGKEIKRNLPTPCPSCSGRRKKTTKTIQDILSGSEKSAWKNPRPWILKEKSSKEDEKSDKGTWKIARGKVGRSLIRRTVELAKERIKRTSTDKILIQKAHRSVKKERPRDQQQNQSSDAQRNAESSTKNMED